MMDAKLKTDGQYHGPSKENQQSQQAYGALLLIRHAHYRCPPAASTQLQLAFIPLELNWKLLKFQAISRDVKNESRTNECKRELIWAVLGQNKQITSNFISPFHDLSCSSFFLSHFRIWVLVRCKIKTRKREKIWNEDKEKAPQCTSLGSKATTLLQKRWQWQWQWQTPLLKLIIQNIIPLFGRQLDRNNNKTPQISIKENLIMIMTA